MKQSHLNLLRLNFSAFDLPWFLQYSDKLLQEARIWQWKKEVLYFLTDWLSEGRNMQATTSGSTGKPKKVALRKQHMEASAKATLNFFGLKAGDKALLCLPEKYIAGKMMIVRSLVGKLDLYCIEPTVAPMAELPGIDFAAMTPAQVAALFETEKGTQFLNSIRQLIVGGSFIPRKLEQQLQKLKTAVWHTYGMTETITHIALRKVNGTGASEWFSPLAGINIRLADDGCLLIDAPHIGVLGMKTNDLVEISETGFRILGRKDNVVISGGIKLFPEEIEQKLEGKIDSRFFLTGIPDEKYGERLALVVEGKRQEETERKLQEIVQSRLSGYEIPKEIVFTDKISFTNSGKIIRTL
ncbi:MAG: AMP-binding protein [Bacteroidales bacterium]|nr:AMP-binding protein [Bacteroidales bacterium]